MNSTDITAKQGFWREHSAAWKASGLTQKAYCEQAGICYKSFVYQHNRLIAKSKATPLKFIQAKPELLAAAHPSTELFLVLPNGIRLGIHGEMNAALLQTVLSVAGGLRC